MKNIKSHKRFAAVITGLFLSVLMTSCIIYRHSEKSTLSNYEEIIKDSSSMANLSNDELVAMYNTAKKVPEQYLFLHENYDIDRSVDSVASIEEASSISREEVHDERSSYSKNIPTSSEVVYEGDTYYITHVAWDHITSENTFSYSTDMVCFKSQYVDYVSPVYQVREFSMTIKDISKAQEIIDLLLYAKNAKMASYKLVISNLEEKDNEYSYHNYCFDGCGGDYGVKDRVDLWLVTYTINKTSGEVAYAGEKLVNSAEAFNIF